MKVNFCKSDFAPFSELITYNFMSRIPINLKLRNYDMVPETIWCRNLSGENFIEFRFDKETMRLYELAIIAIQEETVKNVAANVQVGNAYFECYLMSDSEREISEPIEIIRSEKSLSFVWGEAAMNYTIARNCILGANEQGFLSSVTFLNLNKQTIFEALGF